MSSKWSKLEIEDKVTSILRTVQPYITDHHFGRPFLTAYQLAIAFAEEYTETTSQIGFQVGGEGTGERNSLAQYLAGQLSRLINAGEINHIEGAFLSHKDLNDISFNFRDETIRSSLTSASFDLSMFRLIESE